MPLRFFSIQQIVNWTTPQTMQTASGFLHFIPLRFVVWTSTGTSTNFKTMQTAWRLPSLYAVEVLLNSTNCKLNDPTNYEASYNLYRWTYITQYIHGQLMWAHRFCIFVSGTLAVSDMQSLRTLAMCASMLEPWHSNDTAKLLCKHLIMASKNSEIEPSPRV